LFAAFAVSGVAGLVYEVLWTRYLGLFVGHSAYAQVLVLSVYLGGMAVGALVLGDVSKRVLRPIRWYAGAEGLLAVFGVLFPWVFVRVTELSYAEIFPALGSAGLVGAMRWGVAGLLILPQAMILGATFPLMAAALVRGAPDRPGHGVANVYLLNTLGGAVGVLLAGFWMIGALGLHGTSVAAAAMNIAAAGLAFGAGRRVAPRPSDAATVAWLAPTAEAAAGAARATAGASPTWASRPRALTAFLLAVSFGTALASFAYEVGWIRMLSLALGSATHSFELMLSAFILGLGGGAWWIGRRIDTSPDPLRLLGLVQVGMGLAALASIPLFYFVTFDAMSWLVEQLPGRRGGYALFNLGRYGLALLVMLPATVLAGMTLPILAGTLLRAGSDESAIGRVYGVNTIGSVAGAVAAGLIALPWLGLKGLLIAGAAVDVVLGLCLLEMSARWAGGARRLAAGAAFLATAGFAAVGLGVRLDQDVLSSGVYRHGLMPDTDDRLGLYYADGRTATVSAFVLAAPGVIVLATNGKPDASLDPRWLVEGRDTLPETPIPIGLDLTTQVLAPAIALAHRTNARTVANIGHGSGMSATSFLTSPTIERVVTIEIEPLMVEGSLAFLPANGAAISDPRSSYVFDDAKSFFSYRRERFDIVFAEPSNPWVSGTASLFTVEFYRRVREVLDAGGVFAQWMQIYELDDDLFLSVLAALDKVFPSYRAYLVGDSDVAIIARADGPLEDADWSVVTSPRFRSLMLGVPPFAPSHMESIFLFDQSTFRALLDTGVAANSDYRPVLDLGAEGARFRQSMAEGVYSFATSRVDLPRLLVGEERQPAAYQPPPAYGLVPAIRSERAAWARAAYAAGGGTAPAHFPEWESALLTLQQFLTVTRGPGQPGSWLPWTIGFDIAEDELHWGTNGFADSIFYALAYDYLDRGAAPEEARAVVDLKHGLDRLDWQGVARAADRLVTRVAVGERWMDPGTLLDASVLAYVRTGRLAAARRALESLAPRTGRRPGNLRDRLLAALVTQADAAAPGP
jgi:predicted membrane-bound spermidine synthase